MFLATAVISTLLSALLVFAALRKLSHRPQVVASYAKVGVPETRLNALAGLLLAGAGGLLAGLAWGPLGILAAACLVLYFGLAVGAHVRYDDLANLPAPALMLLLAVAALLLRVGTL